MTDASSPASIRGLLWRFAPVIYGPTVLFALGEGAVLPLLPVFATRLGADVPTAAFVTAALVVGQLCGNIPAGWAVARIGERVTMAVGGGVAMVGVAGLALAPNLVVLTASVFLIGFCAAAFGLARHSFMTTRVPLDFRARALSLLGGTFRLGMFVGPFVAAGLLAVFGDEHATVWFFGVCLVATVLLVLLWPDPDAAAPAAGAGGRPTVADPLLAEDSGEVVTGSIPIGAHGGGAHGGGARCGGARGGGTGASAGAPVGVLRTMWRYRGVLGRLRVAAASLSAVRSARQVVLPLWGLSIGLDAQTIALVVGVSGAIDFALFYASGQVMDRFGRLWAALPAMVLMGAGFLALAVTHDLPQSAMWFALFAAVLGVGNGLSSGILLTLGADVAPQDDPAAFLGSWRTLTDAGGALAPLLVSAITAVISLSVATAAMGVVGLVGAIAFARFVPRFVPRPR